MSNSALQKPHVSKGLTPSLNWMLSPCLRRLLHKCVPTYDQKAFRMTQKPFRMTRKPLFLTTTTLFLTAFFAVFRPDSLQAVIASSLGFSLQLALASSTESAVVSEAARSLSLRNGKRFYNYYNWLRWRFSPSCNRFHDCHTHILTIRKRKV